MVQEQLNKCHLLCYQLKILLKLFHRQSRKLLIISRTFFLRELRKENSKRSNNNSYCLDTCVRIITKKYQEKSFFDFKILIRIIIVQIQCQHVSTENRTIFSTAKQIYKIYTLISNLFLFLVFSFFFFCLEVFIHNLFFFLLWQIIINANRRSKNKIHK